MANDSDGADNNESTFKVEENALNQWPYTLHSIEETLDQKLIEGRGKQLLFQALNNRNLIAFLGSGTSLSYGRLSWSSWLQTQMGLIKRLAEAYLNCAKKSKILLDKQIVFLDKQRQLVDVTRTYLMQLELSSKKKKDEAKEGQKTGQSDPKAKELESEADKIDKEVEEYRKELRILLDDKPLIYSFLQAKSNEVSFHLDEVESLTKTFLHLKVPGEMLGGESHPIVFEVAEQLQEMLMRNEGQFLSEKGLLAFKREEEKTDKKEGEGADENFKSLLEAGVNGFNPDHKTTPVPHKTYDQWVNEEKQGKADLLKEYEFITQKHVSIWSEMLNDKDNVKMDGEAFIETFFVFDKSSRDDYCEALKAYYQVATRPGADFSVSDLAKVLLIDECAHSEQILYEGVEYGLKMGRKEWSDFKGCEKNKEFLEANKRIRSMPSSTDAGNLKRNIGGIRNMPERYWSLGYFKTVSMIHLAKMVEKKFKFSGKIAENWNPVIELVRDELVKNDKNHAKLDIVREVERHFLAPTHRFLWKMLMGLVENPYGDIELPNWAKKKEVKRVAAPLKDVVLCEDDANNRYIYYPVLNEDFKSRLSIGDEDLDPISKLSKNLGIHQFLTVNYDFEIERNFQDRGYTKFIGEENADDPSPTRIRQQEPDSYRINGLGGILRDHSFTRNRASDLINFSIDQNGDNASVFHLHGVATPESELVITERDYMNLYLRNDKHTEVVNESMRVAFSANPIVFLGVGMNEQDLLRPLRQFMSDRDPATSRTTIALLAADLDETARVKTSAALYVRFGVHAIYYGIGWIEVKNIPKKVNGAGPPEIVSKNIEIDWLCRFIKLIKCLGEINKSYAKEVFHKLQVKNKWDWPDDWEKELKEIYDGSKIKQCDIDVLLGKFKNFHQEKPNIDVHRDQNLIDYLTEAKKINGLNEGQINWIDKVLSSLRIKIDEPSPITNFRNAEDILAKIENDLGKDIENDQNLRILDILVGKFLGKEKPERIIAVQRHFNGKSQGFAECHFERVRAKEDVKNRAQQSKSYLLFEYRLMGHMFRMTLEQGNQSLPEKFNELRCMLRDINARITALDSLTNAVLTATTCAALDNLERERAEWWDLWQKSPPHRIAKFKTKSIKPEAASTDLPGTSVSLGDNVPMPVKYIRHELEPMNIKLTKPEERIAWNSKAVYESNDRILSKKTTGVRVFDTFLDAMEKRVAADQKQKSAGLGRRFYYVAAHRGLGKGAFLTAFASENGLRQYIASAWSQGNYRVHTGNSNFKKTSNNWDEFLGFSKFRPYYHGAVFINLSFSSELASIYDMLAGALIDMICEIDTNYLDGKMDKQMLVKELDAIPRMRKIERLFSIFSEVSGNANFASKGFGTHKIYVQSRFLLCISSADLMNQSGGLSKNREIEEFYTFLTSEKTEEMPFDLILVADEDNITELLTERSALSERYNVLISSDDFQSAGLYETKQRELPLFVPLTRHDIDLKGIQNINRREHLSFIDFKDHYTELDKSKLNGAVSKPLVGLKRKKNANSDQVCYVYHGRIMLGEEHLIDNFFPLAILLFANFAITKVVDSERLLLLNRLMNKEYNLYGGRISHEDREKIWTKPTINWSDAWKDLKNDRDSECRKAFKKFIVELIKLSICAPEMGSIEKVEYLKALGLKEMADRVIDKVNTSIVKKKVRSGANEIITDSDIEAILLARYRAKPINAKNEGQAYEEWREISNLLRGNRYCLTIMLAAAQKIGFAGKNVERGAEHAEAFIRDTINPVKMIRLDRREETVLRCVFNAYEQFNKIGDPAHDEQLHAIILRHLAVIGAPCAADILVRTPEVRHYFDALVEESIRSRESHLVEALTELAERGLVFRIKPHPRMVTLADDLEKLREQENLADQEKKANEIPGTDETKQFKKLMKMREHYKGDTQKSEDITYEKLKKQNLGPGEIGLKYRYALHRLVQRHIALKMNSGPQELIEINSFAPSVFASMDADLPRPNLESYNFLTQLIDSLSQYPDHKSRVPGAENWHFGMSSISTKMQALRAALTVARSSFSIAVVSRFDDYKMLSTEQGTPKRGYFEQYRVQIRWLLRQAYELLPAAGKTYQAKSPHHNHINAFYADEIVWLYNEVGVINLVQGNVRDAVALLRQAITINQDIEGPLAGGAQDNRISLNLAIAQIDRGRLDSAKKRLLNICATESLYSQRKGRIWHIAHGYLGAIYRLNGDFEEASRHYKRAVSVLRIYNDSRACAIFCRHHGEMQRERNHFVKARRYLEDALAFAEAGGHEDISKRTRLAFIDLKIREQRFEKIKIDAREVLAELRVIENYAKIMSMPSLQCDVQLIHASLMMADGETSQAGQLLSHTITVAKRNDMNLRLNSALTSYGQVLGLRNLHAQANRMLFNSLEMAKRSKNQLEIERIETEFHRLHTM